MKTRSGFTSTTPASSPAKVKTDEAPKTKEGAKKVTASAKPVPVVIPKGRPKSGRIWKGSKQRASSMIKSKSKVGSQAPAIRANRSSVKALSDDIKAAINGEAAAKRERTEANKLKKLENEKKSEVVQVIKNPAKLKRMKKKSLRQIQKRDTNPVATTITKAVGRRSTPVSTGTACPL